MGHQLPQQSHHLPPAPDAERQVPHYLLRALLCIALFIDGCIALALMLVLVLTLASSGAAAFSLFPAGLTTLLLGMGIPMVVITFVLYAGYRATRLKDPYSD